MIPALGGLRQRGLPGVRGRATLKPEILLSRCAESMGVRKKIRYLKRLKVETQNSGLGLRASMPDEEVLQLLQLYSACLETGLLLLMASLNMPFV